MKCVICKHGETAEGTATVTLERDGAMLVFKDVPAMICDNCGEQYIDADTTKTLLRHAARLIENGAEVDVRTYRPAA